jgi:hypothetical protein
MTEKTFKEKLNEAIKKGDLEFLEAVDLHIWDLFKKLQKTRHIFNIDLHQTGTAVLKIYDEKRRFTGEMYCFFISDDGIVPKENIFQMRGLFHE